MDLAYNFVELPTPKLSHIPMEFDRKISFNMGKLVPILVQDIVPGDSFHCQVSDIIRFSPLVSPVYHRLDCKIRFFFVPNRLVWDKWEDFLLSHGSMSPCTFTPAEWYELAGAVASTGSLWDYMDFPTQLDNDWMESNTEPLDLLPWRAQKLIWNEYFRAAEIQPELPIFKDKDSLTYEEALTMRSLMDIGWEKDYFTTATPMPQAGAAVDIPVKLAPDGSFRLKANYDEGQSWEITDYLSPSNPSGSIPGNVTIKSSLGSQKGVTSYSAGIKNVGTIEELRRANHLQRWLEKGNYSPRYNEFILANFGVSVPDYRIDRPEYIGGSVHPITIGRVLNTAQSDDYPLGSYAGQAEGTGKSDWINYYAFEHGYIIAFMSVMPRSGYYQGIERKYIKRDIFDYYFPDFATIGDQEILDDEIFARPAEQGKGTFGYTQRYAHMKYNSDKVNGEMRTTLDYWHMARKLSGPPALNSQFITADPTDRIFATGMSDEMNAEFYFDLKMVRPMPLGVMPTIED